MRRTTPGMGGMVITNLPVIPNATLITGGDRQGRSNSVWLVGDGILKVYRRRRSCLREEAGEAAAWFFHRKCGVSVAKRYETEQRSLEVWRRHGFDVPRTLERPFPDGVAPPAIWLEYCPGRRLYEVVAEKPPQEQLLWRLGAVMSRRHALALETCEPLLVHEKGTLKHVLVSGDRLVTFDFEQGYRRSFPMLEALTEELAGYLRSLAQATEAHFDRALHAFVEGYADRARLWRIAHWGVGGMSLYRFVKRLQDGWRRAHPKVDVLRQLMSLLATNRSLESK